MQDPAVAIEEPQVASPEPPKAPPPGPPTPTKKPFFAWPLHVTPLELFAGLLAGFTLVALTNAIAIPFSVPWPHGGLRVRIEQHLFDATELIGVGALAGAILAFARRYVRAPLWVEVVAYTAAGAGGMYPSVGQDLHRQALVGLKGHLELPFFVVLLILSGMAVPAAHQIGAAFSRLNRLRAIPLLVALGGIVTNQLVVRDDYAGLHAAITWVAATLAGATLAPPVARLLLRFVARFGRVRVASVIAAIAGFGLFVPPPNAVRMELFREEACVASWILAAAYWRSPTLSVAPPESPWYADRSDLPPIPPTVPPLLQKPPVVVMITIDATRADDIADPAHDALFPTFAMLKKSSAFFTDATSPGGQTAVSLTTAFSGRYFSELYWSMHGVGETRFAYAADDTAAALPELLSARNISTVSFCSVNFLAGEFGVIRGFREERVIPRGRNHAFAQEMVEPLLDRLRRTGTGAIFLYTHLMEPHAPYDRGADRTGSDHERYLSEIAVADRQLGRVVELLDQRFRDRAYLIVSADHGEAFGEHGTREHTKTLYEELLRVPLLIRGPGIRPRSIDEHVGLVDVGPTMLDLFGLPTPAPFEGQSLVPLLAGRPSGLERPLAAEGRLRHAFYFGATQKVIEDPRRKTVEVYDLARDPGELDNLFDSDRAASEPAIAALRTFFAAHALRKPGYSPVYKP